MQGASTQLLGGGWANVNVEKRREQEREEVNQGVGLSRGRTLCHAGVGELEAAGRRGGGKVGELGLETTFRRRAREGGELFRTW